MLAVQYIHINWIKEFRDPSGANARRPFWEPHELAADVDLNGEGIFLNRIDLIQRSDKIMPGNEYFHKAFRVRKMEMIGDHSKEYEETDSYHRRCRKVNEKTQENNGVFVDELDLPGIEVREENGEFIIFWYSMDDGFYVPTRTGHNVNYNNEDSKACGKNIKCVEAFRLGKGESGKLGYNYRIRYPEGGFTYSEYKVYLINTESLTRNMFKKAQYEKVFEDMADLY